MEALAVTPGAPGRRRYLARAVPDHRLAARIRSGDERAFELLFERYHRPLLAFCRHMLGTREEAEDALQQVFVAAHRHLVARDVVDLRPWLYAIARNRCLSVLRARRETVALDDVPEPSFEGLSVAADVEQRQELQATLGDLARLPDQQRAALVLSELGSLSHEEIASVLGVRRDKVKALVFQARESLAGWRAARDADCGEIREQLANVRGGALRRGPLRKHLEACEGCRTFRSEVRRQREAMAMLLPVIPTVALKAKVIGAVTAAGSSAAPAGIGAGAATGALSAGVAGSSGAVVSALGGGMAAKALVVAVVAGASAGSIAVVESAPERVSPAPAKQLPRAIAAPPQAPAAPESPAAAGTSSFGSPSAEPKSPARPARGARGRPEGPGARPPGRGSAVPADRARGNGRSDAATPGDPGRPPDAAGAPGQAKEKRARDRPAGPKAPAAGADRAAPTPPVRGRPSGALTPGSARPKLKPKPKPKPAVEPKKAPRARPEAPAGAAVRPPRPERAAPSADDAPAAR